MTSAGDDELAALGYAVSHDLRAPLRTIEGFGQALAEEYGEALGEEGRDYLRRIRGAAARMEQLIAALLRLAQVSRGELQREAVDLTALAESIAAKLREAEPARDVAFSVEPGLVVDADRALLRAALEELLGNAWKFTAKHASATIEVGSEQRQGRRVVYVRDDGAGFDPAFAERMFTPFQRFHRADEFDGVGIGLAIVRRIVHRHGGEVRAEGEVGKGAAFLLTLQ